MHVSDYMSKPASISADHDYGAAFQLMKEQGWDHVPVTDHHDIVVGVLSRRKAELAGYRYQTAPVEVREVLEDEVLTIADSESLATAAAHMAQGRADVMLVLDSAGHPVGLLSDTDLHRALTDLLHGYAHTQAPT